MKSKPYFKKIEIEDYVEVVHLVNSSYRGDSSQQGWTTEALYLDGQRTDHEMLLGELKDPNKTLLILRTEGSSEIIGTVMLEKMKEEKEVSFYLGMLTIKPDLQNKGLGKWMMTEAEAFAKNSGGVKIILGVLNPRVELMSWYERRGYARNGQREDFPYGEEKFGIPKIKDLHFVMFEKTIF